MATLSVECLNIHVCSLRHLFTVLAGAKHLLKLHCFKN